MAPRISLTPVGGVDSSGGSIGMGPRSPDGRPFLFEVLGAPGSAEGRESPGWTGGNDDADQLAARGMTSLENVPPPALDPRMWTEANGTEFSVRGPSYVTTRVKVPSAKQVKKKSGFIRYVSGG